MILAAQSFEIAGPPTQMLLVAGVVLVVLLGTAVFIGRIILGMRNASFTVEGDALLIKAPLYSRNIPKSALKLDDAKIVTLRDTPDLQPNLKLNGAAMGGLRVGKFKLRNNATAMVYVTQSDKTLVIPTSEGYTLLLETPQAEQLLASLKG